MEIGAFEAKNRLGSLLDLAEQGEEIIITRHGKGVAVLGPYSPSINSELAKAALVRIRSRARSVKGRFDWDSLKADRDADRP
jgi:prevent-host-death family protein